MLVDAPYFDSLCGLVLLIHYFVVVSMFDKVFTKFLVLFSECGSVSGDWVIQYSDNLVLCLQDPVIDSLQ